MICLLLAAVLSLPVLGGVSWGIAAALGLILRPIALPTGGQVDATRVWLLPQLTARSFNRIVTAWVFTMAIGWLLSLGAITAVATDRQLDSIRNVDNVSSEIGAPAAPTTEREPFNGSVAFFASTLGFNLLGAMGLAGIVTYARRRVLVVSAQADHLLIEFPFSTPIAMPWSEISGLRVEVDGLQLEGTHAQWMPSPVIAPSELNTMSLALEQARREGQRR